MAGKRILIVLVTAALFLILAGAPVKASAPKAYLSYYNNSDNTVTVTVYWDDTGGGSTVQWADDVLASGAALNWQIGGLTVSGSGTNNARAVLADAREYKNYFFKLTKGGETANIRAFPVDYINPPATVPALREDENGYYPGPRYFNDYAHGNFRPDTPMCEGCHSTHSSLKAQLLKQATYYELCLLCHGTAANQSKYDVQSGKVKTAAGWKDSLAGPIGTGIGTSRHNVDDRSSVDTTVYGSVPGKLLTFTCISCHKGHGGSNDNYRLIRETIYPANDKFVATNVYYTAYAVVKDPAVGEEVYMVSGNTEFCTACHLDYDDGDTRMPGGIYADSTVPVWNPDFNAALPSAKRFRHPVTVGSSVYSVYRLNPLRNWYPAEEDNLPLQVYSSGESTGADKRTAVVCSTCHYAHGTYKEFNMDYPLTNGEVDRISNQKMLRLGNYGVCESCHKK